MGNVIFRDNVKQVTHKDMGISEDEFNNFLIDCHLLLKELDKPKETKNEIVNPIGGESVTITLTKENYYRP